MQIVPFNLQLMVTFRSHWRAWNLLSGGTLSHLDIGEWLKLVLGRKDWVRHAFWHDLTHIEVIKKAHHVSLRIATDIPQRRIIIVGQHEAVCVQTPQHRIY